MPRLPKGDRDVQYLTADLPLVLLRRKHYRVVQPVRPAQDHGSLPVLHPAARVVSIISISSMQSTLQHNAIYHT